MAGRRGRRAVIPRIGITCGEDEGGRFSLPRGCAEAVALAGGQPVILPPVAAGVPRPGLLASPGQGGGP